MIDMNNLLNCMGTLFLLLAVGFLCNKVGILTPANNKLLSRLVVNVTLPATLLNAVVGTSVDIHSPEAKQLFGAIALYYSVLAILAFFISRAIAARHPDRGVYQYMCMFSNTGFLGIPLITAMFGQEALFHVALFNIPFNILAFTYGIAMIRGKREGEKTSLKKVLTPPTVASFVALILFLMGVTFPKAIDDAVSYVGGVTVPCAMMVVGASLATIPAGKVWKDWRMYVVGGYTLLLRPVIIWALASLFVTDPLVLGVTVILASVPVGANTTSLCIQYDANETLSSCSIFITTALSMLTIPVVALVLL